MKKILVISLGIFNSYFLSAQPNCNVFLWNGDTLQYQACKLSERFNDYYQFDMKGIAILDSCLAICPYFADAHYEYAVVYLKAGNPIGWSKHIDQAVKYDPKNYLALRASCRGKTFADYQGSIDDINKLDELVEYDIGFVHDGAYHLHAYKALCYKELGNYEKAISAYEDFIKNTPEHVGFLDMIHMGVCYQKIGAHLKALDCFQKQEELNDLAENNYYAAISHKALGNDDEFMDYLKKVEKKLKTNQKMLDAFHVREDEVFWSDLIALKTLKD